ncbi:FtsX-like permease family protein [Actinoplanes sp. NPDC051343]|uniref:FtsX-like permease family protein n=1 Tax=Actinoplanes sp. NPDC051343 TaxID=3363906 RepID=UPI00379A915B
MMGMSRAGLAERWPLFAGAFVSVTLGVALVQSSLLLLISAATMDPPAGMGAAARMEFSDNIAAVVSMLGIVLGLATFLAGFVISSTFAFTVAQRRRDLALLRLVGGSRGQVRRMLLGEALLLGGLGAAAGVPAGLAVMAAQEGLLRTLGFVPAGFHGQWREWILAVSFGAGIGLAVSGAAVAARRASRVRPLEALRDTGEAARVMTVTRWIAALIFFGGALALVIVAPHGGVGGGAAMAMNVPLPAAVAAAALSPLIVPLVARLLPTGAGVAGLLARANLRDARRRSASIAAPVIVLIALVAGTAGAQAAFTASGVDQMRRQTHADLVVQGQGPLGARIADVPGVAAASTETAVPATIVTGHGEDEESDTGIALVIDPPAYEKAHGTASALTELHGRAVAAGSGGEVPSSGNIRLKLPDTDLGELPVVAGVPATMSGGANLLLPPGVVPPNLLADAPTQSFVSLAPGADRNAVRAALSRIGHVSDLDPWLKADATDRNSTSNKIMVVVMGLGGLYALIGVINSIVIGAAARRREFAEARVTGLTRTQVVRSALAESAAVTVAGLILGGVAAAGALIAAAASTAAVTGRAAWSLPWPLIAAVCAVALLVTAMTSLITSWSATRRPPVTLLGARE